MGITAHHVKAEKAQLTCLKVARGAYEKYIVDINDMGCGLAGMVAHSRQVPDAHLQFLLLRVPAHGQAPFPLSEWRFMNATCEGESF